LFYVVERNIKIKINFIICKLKFTFVYMKVKNGETVLVRVSVSTYKKVVKHVEKTKQNIGGFYDLSAEEKLKKEAKMNR
jgi:hypothetical protein